MGSRRAQKSKKQANHSSGQSDDQKRYLYRRDVRVPLRPCDYTEPLIARTFPFQPDSPEDELSLSLASQLMLDVPFLRRFQHWPGRRATEAAYGEMQRVLVKYGYSAKNIKKMSLVDVADVLCEGHGREQSRAHLEALLLERGYSGPVPSAEVIAQIAVQRPDGSIPIEDLVEFVLQASDKKREWPPETGGGKAKIPQSKKPTAPEQKAFDSYKWIQDNCPDLISILKEGQRFSVKMYNHIREQCPVYEDSKVPSYESWQRYIRAYEQKVHGPKNAPRASRGQPTGAKPSEIQSLSEITSKFSKTD